MKFAIAALSLVLAGVGAGIASAEDNSAVAMGLNGGTLGAGINGQFAVTKSLVVRAEANTLSYNDKFKSSDVSYSGRLRFNTGSMGLEWHPAGGGLFVGAGLLGGDRKVSVTGLPTAGANQTFKVNGVTYTLSQLAQIKGSVDMGSSAPFVGLGWDNTFSSSSRWGFRIAAGVAVGDAPKVHLTASGPLANDPTVQSNLRAEEASLAKDVKDLRNYPLVQIGLSRRF
jgi:hypothetical protein